MGSIVSGIKQAACAGLKNMAQEQDIRPEDILVNEVKPEFEGDFAVVLFPFVKRLKLPPDELGHKLGHFLVSNYEWIASFSLIKGFLNLTITDKYLLTFLHQNFDNNIIGQVPKNGRKVMIEYSSPNTNKPLHFGHLRNNFLGWSVAEILKYQGIEVIKANLVNDRGIHICKSMIAWMRYAGGATPENTGIKGDHLVGDYYVKFNDVYKEEIEGLVAQGVRKDEAEKQAPIFLEAQDLLRRWEDGDAEVRQLWKTMNGWVLEGFDKTYQALGIDFDKVYYESETYLLGKGMVAEGLRNGILFTKENGSVWIDLSADGLDEKLLLRADGTSVYMTQDLGTARLKYSDFGMDQSVYVIADEQNYHMQVLKLILQKLHEPCADGIFHLSYGMVELPSGRMKSREGTVVDADDMIAEMIALAGQQSEESGKTEGFSNEELQALYSQVGLGALKFYLLRVDPKKKMIFDPKESIDLHGFTATFIQYAHARINSIIRKVGTPENDIIPEDESLFPLEKKLLLQLEQFPVALEQAAREYNPAAVCNYAFKLAQSFNSFFDQHSVIRAENSSKKLLRLRIALLTRTILEKSLFLLGIQAPERM
ncbi:MAG TPA: arginine--tRNA ligase [Edaphocola sp.]|nr:arginine--tRNA ligase [Edaphocola sp.]